MTKRLEIYRCKECGNMVQILEAGAGELVCCGENMKLQEARMKEEEGLSGEKHLPVTEKIEGGVRILVGSRPHPMEAAHYIEFIEEIAEGGREVRLRFLEPGEEPMAEFRGSFGGGEALEYCNIHGLWKSVE